MKKTKQNKKVSTLLVVLRIKWRHLMHYKSYSKLYKLIKVRRFCGQLCLWSYIFLEKTTWKANNSKPPAVESVLVVQRNSAYRHHSYSQRSFLLLHFFFRHFSFILLLVWFQAQSCVWLSLSGKVPRLDAATKKSFSSCWLFQTNVKSEALAILP